MGPPGLAMVAVSPKAWRQIESIERQAFYFDLTAYRKALAEPDTPYTPAIPLVVALAESLRQICRLGIETVWARTNLLARATRAGVQALGMRLAAARPADSLTAAYFPERVDGKKFLKRLETRFGVKLAGGQGRLKGKILRIGHFGVIDELDILSALAAMELVLVEMGQSVKLGSGVAAPARFWPRRRCLGTIDENEFENSLRREPMSTAKDEARELLERIRITPRGTTSFISSTWRRRSRRDSMM